jgi:hypothetical protein
MIGRLLGHTQVQTTHGYADPLRVGLNEVGGMLRPSSAYRRGALDHARSRGDSGNHWGQTIIPARARGPDFVDRQMQDCIGSYNSGASAVDPRLLGTIVVLP